MIATAKLVTSAALAREESRGAHFRRDFPQTNKIAKRTFVTLAEAENIARSTVDEHAVAAC